MMNETCNACAPQEAPAILSVTEENAKMAELANARIESILRKLRGEKPVRQTEGCVAEPTERQQRQLNRLLHSIDELDSLI